MKRRLGIGLVVAMAAGAGLVATREAPVPSAEAQVADTFDVVRERLRTFETAYLVGEHAGQNAAIQVTAEGPRVAIDPLEAYEYRFVWSDGILSTMEQTRSTMTCPPRLSVPAPPQLGEMWAEVRSGFANSTVTHTRPEEIGYRFGWAAVGTRSPTDVVMIVLPFEWATDVRVFLQYYVHDGGLLNLLVTDAAGRDLPSPLPVKPRGSNFYVHFYPQIPWDVPLDPGIFRGSMAEVEPSAYSTCERESGHRHGAQLHQEHTEDEIHGRGTPRHKGAWDPSCDADLPPDDLPGRSGLDHGQGHDADHGQDGGDHAKAKSR